MKTTTVLSLILMLVLLAGCGGSSKAPTSSEASNPVSKSQQTTPEVKLVSEQDNVSVQQDTTQQDAVQEDTTQQDSIQPDTTQEDTAQEDTVQPDTTQEDTTQEDTAQQDTTESGGMIPAESAEHHVKVCDQVVMDALEKSGLKISDIDFEKNHITTTSRKTRKSMGARPVPAIVMAELKKFTNDSDAGQAKLFNDIYSQKKWKKICKSAGLYDLKFHDLRKTFCSMLAQNGVSTAVAQRLLEHVSPNLTNKVYTNVEPVLRYAVEQIPVIKWL